MFYEGDAILEQEFAFFEAAQQQFVAGWRCRQASNGIVEIAMLCAQIVQLRAQLRFAFVGEPTGWRLPMVPVFTSLAALSALSLLIWQASGVASASATFNLPLLSSAPCVAMTALLSLLGGIGAWRLRGRARRISLRRA